MKGITHFAVGLASATFFKKAVEMAREGNFILVLGGIFGILADTLDFKFYRFFYPHKYIIDPDPNNPNAQEIAETMARAIDEAYTTGKQVDVQLHTMRLGINLWRRYTVSFDQINNKVIVDIGPIITTGQVPYPGTEPKENAHAEVALKQGKIYQELSKPVNTDIMSGPSLGFYRKGDRVEMIFLPWHRQWSHSFTLGGICGVLVWLFFSLFYGLKESFIYGLVSAVAFWLHVFVDTWGFMGGNLFWLVYNKRTSGLKIASASNPLMNFMLVWASVATIAFNLNRFNPQPAFFKPWYIYYGYVVVLPGLILWLLTRLFTPKEVVQSETVETTSQRQMDEVKKEAEDEFVG